jgi:pimeloyl-ACP methyl ester carboxylesterase
MGGMIAQTIAIERASRVRTLISIMSTTGSPDLPQAKPEVIAASLSPVSTERAAAVERGLVTSRVLGSPAHPLDEAEERALLKRIFDRGIHPTGVARQLLAVIAAEDRREKLASVRAPTLVIHGTADPIIAVDTLRLDPGRQAPRDQGNGSTTCRPRCGR